MGFCIEPTSAATIAGLRKYLNHSGKEQVVSLFSGHGLKSTEKILKILS
jgi:threonine synthase